MMSMIAAMDRRAFLEDFLSRHALPGTTCESLVAEVDGVLEPPPIIAATGSVVEGFGNGASDVDILAILDRASLSQFPITTYSLGIRVDILFFSPADAEARCARVIGQPWPPRQATRVAWLERHGSILMSTRLLLSVLLRSDPATDAAQAKLAIPLRDAVVRWWDIEARRRRVVADWLIERNPRLATQRLTDAVLAFLEARVAERGELYFSPQWLPLKLDRLGERSWSAIMRQALKAPLRRADAAAFRSWVDDVLGPTPPGDRLAMQATWAPGVRRMDIDDQVVLSRWGMRGLVIPRSDLSTPQGDRPVFEVGVGDDPPRALIDLVAGDMVWLGIVSLGSESS